MMRKAIEATREKLLPFIGGTSDMPFVLPEPSYDFTAPPEPHPGRFIRKIPERNYEKLGKFLPISWL